MICRPLVRAAVEEQLPDPRLVARADRDAAAPVRAAGHRRQTLAVDLDPSIVVTHPAEVAAAADRLQDVLEEHLLQRLPEESAAARARAG